MIEQILRYFATFRALEANLAAECLKSERLNGDVNYWRARYESVDEQAKFWRDRCESADKRRDEVTAELTDVLRTAGDSLGLRVTGRRLFSKATVEAPPSDEPKPPINVSAGSGKRFAGDVARQGTSEFFRDLAKQAGVIPEQKPN